MFGVAPSIIRADAVKESAADRGSYCNSGTRGRQTFGVSGEYSNPQKPYDQSDNAGRAESF